MQTIMWCTAGFGLRPLQFVLYTADVIGIALGRGARIHVCRRHLDLRQLLRIGSSTRCHSSVGLRIGNRIVDKLKSTETEFLET